MLLKIIFIVALIDIRHVNCHFIDLNNKIIRNMLQNTEFCGIINTETAGNPDFSGLPAFFVTNLLLVQCSI